MRMSAYYYSFTPTGVDAIDRILSAVACAGKAYHNTEDWSEPADPWEGLQGENPIEWIQNAALTAAKALCDTPTAEEITWLQAMLSDAVELLETAQSGFIPGCGADTRWTDRCDKTLERYRARNKQ